MKKHIINVAALLLTALTACQGVKTGSSPSAYVDREGMLVEEAAAVEEALPFSPDSIAEKVVEVTLSSDGETDPLAVLEKVKASKLQAESYSFSGGKIHLSLRMRQKDSLETLRNLVNKLEGIRIEDLY